MEQVSGMDASLVVATPLVPSGYTWTLASRLGQMLQLAEERFGPRDKSYTPLGVEFAGDRPQVWYPSDCKNIIIQLSLNCLNDPVEARRQLAHECVHLLAPTGVSGAIVLEEGMAEWFSELYTAVYLPEEYKNTPRLVFPNYAEALKLTQGLLSFGPDLIRQIRLTEPVINNITADLIRAHCPAVPEDLAIALTQPFQ